MTSHNTDELFALLRETPMDKRRKLPGLSKDRADLIVPGLAILRNLFKVCRAERYLVCGAGLRDGLFYDSVLHEDRQLDDVLEYSIGNLNALYPEAPKAHVEQVNRLALRLFKALKGQYPFPPEARKWVHTASMLFRIGAGIDYYQYSKHTFYLMTNVHLNGLSHREIILAAGIASYKSRGAARLLHLKYRPILTEEDVEVICRLGTLLELAVALDRSEAQSVTKLDVEQKNARLLLKPRYSAGSLEVERKEIDVLAGDFKKAWKLTPVLVAED
jgi:exopolyphosphatase/guanosine-5'-triphosphate,3'-diphosphate pyrophosphatase